MASKSGAGNLGVGVMGCGNISAAYFSLSKLFKGMEIRACADLNMKLAQSRAAEYGVRAEKPANLLAADDIDIIVNLTIPAAHYEVSKSALDAGKHVYSEKPLAMSYDEAKALTETRQRQQHRRDNANAFIAGQQADHHGGDPHG